MIKKKCLIINVFAAIAFSSFSLGCSASQHWEKMDNMVKNTWNNQKDDPAPKKFEFSGTARPSQPSAFTRTVVRPSGQINVNKSFTTPTTHFNINHNIEPRSSINIDKNRSFNINKNIEVQRNFGRNIFPSHNVYPKPTTLYRNKFPPRYSHYIGSRTFTPRYHWNHYYYHRFPRDAFFFGLSLGIPLYFCQAYYQNGIYPGLVYDNSCDFGYGGTIVHVPEYRVLSGSAFYWVHVNDPYELPSNAVIGGYEEDQPLYICRVVYQGSSLAGRDIPGDGCHFVYHDREFVATQFDILVERE